MAEGGASQFPSVEGVETVVVDEGSLPTSILAALEKRPDDVVAIEAWSVEVVKRSTRSCPLPPSPRPLPVVEDGKMGAVGKDNDDDRGEARPEEESVPTAPPVALKDVFV